MNAWLRNMLAGAGGLQAPFHSQLLLNEIGKTVIFDQACRQILGPFDQADTSSTAAIALKGLVHVPLRRRIKESKLLAILNRFQRKEQLLRGVKKRIRITTVIDAFKIIRQ